jgi:acetyltransferase-like isoleucine patch superfamily enzyme
MRRLVKPLVRAIFLALALPGAAISGFGRWKAAFRFFAQANSPMPGVIGEHLRAAYYRMTLAECPLDCCISFGTFFAHPEARVGSRVYIGAYCVLGMVAIGERTQIASGVQIISGRRQHARDEHGHISGAEEGEFTMVTIGPDCWVGAAAVVMADVGEGTTIGAGSVVTKAIPPGVVAFGNPARVKE